MHLHGLWMHASATCLAWRRRTSRPSIISPHGMLDPWALDSSGWKKRIARRLYEDANLHSASCIHALCDGEMKTIRTLGFRKPVAVIPNGVDLPHPAKNGRDCKTPADWHDRRIMLFLGRVHPKKGLVALVHAWRGVPEAHHDWALGLAGPDEGGHQREVQFLIDSLNLNESVRFLGPKYGQDKDAWLRRADAFVLPSLSEGFPVAALEALSYGLPALLTPQCNFPGAGLQGAAITVSPDPEALAEGLRRLISLPAAERDLMGQQGRDLVAKHHSWQHIARQMIEVYEWLLGHRGRPTCVITD